MVIFHSFLYVYQRVIQFLLYYVFVVVFDMESYGRVSNSVRYSGEPTTLTDMDVHPSTINL